MRLAIDIDTKMMVSWANSPITTLAMTRRDRFPVEVKFIQGGKYVELPAGAAGVLALKVAGGWADVERASGGQWAKTGSGRDTVYTFILSLDTTELNALYSSEPDFVAMAMEVSWSYSLGGTPVRETAGAVAVRVANDYIR